MLHEQLAALAATTRRLRESHSLSLAQLSERTGVAKATLFKIEAERTNPTLGTLLALADALSVPVGDLISTEAKPEVVVVRSGDGQPVPDSVLGARLLKSMLVGYTLVEVYDLTVPGGQSEVSVSHGPGAREHVIVRSGRVRVGPLDDPVELGPGDYATYTSAEMHRWSALGGRPARVWLIHTFPRPPAAPG